MNSIECKLDFKKIKSDLLVGIYECTQRGLNQSAKWLSELNLSISHIKLSPEELPTRCIDFGDESEEYFMAKSCFDVKEYDRSAYFSQNCKKTVNKFLHYYAKYMSIEKKKLDNMTDSIRDPTQNVGLSDLSGVLKSEFYENKLDGYCLYLYGVVLRKLELIPLAIEAFIQSVNAAPLMWGSWQELGQLIPNKKNLDLAQLPEHWMKYFFLAHTYLEQLDNDEAMELYINLREQGFEKSSYLVAQTAIIYYNRRELDKSIELFKELEKIDPYRLDNLDTYSNLLYVREMNIQLAVLAHRAVSIDKYRVETCCVVGNYYSLRSDHTKAVTYFRRALKIKPNYLSAWTLIGHEFMELKNVNAAIQSYRRAIEINSRDYRAWYGLGQTYEMLKMPLYCLYYYKQATQFRPNDSRMIMALGETYEKLDKSENALKCYYRACNVGDVEGMALVKLAKLLYDKLNEYDNAAAAYTDYCLLAENQKDRPLDEQSEFYSAFQYLANFHLKKGNLDIAQVYAFKCLESEETKEQGKAYLKTIAATRGHQEIEPVAMDETCLSEIENESNGSNMDIVFSPSVPLP